MDSEALLIKLKDAFNAHDTESILQCFDEKYTSEQPIHPNRMFQGRDQVKKNWASNFTEMPDFSVKLLRYCTSKDDMWAEWEWQGTRQNKTRLFMRGVIIMGVNNGKIIWGRLYIEPVEVIGRGIDAAVEEVMHGKIKTKGLED
jgi:hypothetical protein